MESRISTFGLINMGYACFARGQIDEIEMIVDKIDWMQPQAPGLAIALIESGKGDLLKNVNISTKGFAEAAAGAGSLALMKFAHSRMSAIEWSNHVRTASILGKTSASGYIEVMKFLLQHTHVDYIDKFGETALMWAAYYNQPEMIEFLLEEGASREIKRPDGKTAAGMAKERGNLRCMELIDGSSQYPDRARAAAAMRFHYEKFEQARQCFEKF